MIGFFQIPLAFATLYAAGGRLFEVPLSWHEAIYFSVVTASTLGFGDLHPIAGSLLGEALVTFELVLSVFFLSVLVARLVGDVIADGTIGPGGTKAGH